MGCAWQWGVTPFPAVLSLWNYLLSYLMAYTSEQHCMRWIMTVRYLDQCIAGAQKYKWQDNWNMKIRNGRVGLGHLALRVSPVHQDHSWSSNSVSLSSTVTLYLSNAVISKSLLLSLLNELLCLCTHCPWVRTFQNSPSSKWRNVFISVLNSLTLILKQ